MRPTARGRVSFAVIGVRARDRSGTAEEAAVRAWLQGVRDDLEQGAAGGITLDLEWRGWLESSLVAEDLAALDLAALVAHARGLTTAAIPGRALAIVNCPVRTGTVVGDLVASWVGLGGQGGLRCCHHCGALHLASNAALSHCWGSPTGTHEYDDGDFEVARGSEGDRHHQNCSSCHAVWAFDGHSRGHCPKNPTGHTGGDRYRIPSASMSDEQGEWAECTACQRVIAIARAHAGCIDSTEASPVAHALDDERRLVVGHERAPTLSWGVETFARALGVEPDLVGIATPAGTTGHPRFARRGPVPSAAAAWAAGWLAPTRVATIGWRRGQKRELAIGRGTGDAPMVVQIDAPGGLYAVEIDRRSRSLDDDPTRDTLALRRFLGRGPRSHDGWRACRACGAAVDTAALECAAGGIHEPGDEPLAVPIDQGYVRAIAGWRRCRRCNGLFHHAADEPSACPSGGVHEAVAGEAYGLRTSEVATGFRACRRCRGLVDPAHADAACPAGGTHETKRSPHFILDGVHRKATTSAGWASCRRCGVVVYTREVTCVAGVHAFAPEDHTVEPWRLSSGLVPMWRCSGCRGLVAGPGPCSAGGRHKIASLLPTHALHDKASEDAAIAPREGEPEFPGGHDAIAQLRPTWRVCGGCSLVVQGGVAGRCVATGKAHRVGGPALAMGGHALDARRVLVDVGSVVAADRDRFVVRTIEHGDSELRVAVEPDE